MLSKLDFLKDYHSFSKMIKLRIVLLLISVLFNAMVMPYVVVYFVERVGINKASLMVLGVGIAGILGGLLGGKLGDKYGRKKMIIFGEIGTGIGFFLACFSSVFTEMLIAIIFISFLLIYFFSGLSGPAYSAFIIDETTNKNRKSVYVVMLWVSNLSFALGSILGGFLFKQYSSLLFFLVGCSSILSCICIAILVQDHFIKRKVESNNLRVKNQIKANSNKLKVYQHMLKAPIFQFLVMLTLILSLMNNQLPYYLSVHYVNIFETEGYTILGFLRSENTLIIFFLTFVITNLLKKVYEIKSLLFGVLLFFIGYIALSMGEIPSILYMAMAIMSIGQIIYSPVIQTISADVIPDEHRSTYLSILDVIGHIGGLCAFLFVPLMQYIQPFKITIIYGVFGFISLIIIYRIKQNRKEEKISIINVS